MALYVQDRLYLQIVIGGIEVPIDILNSVGHVHIVEHVRLLLPQLSMAITDTTKFFTLNNVLVDGAVISITVGNVNKTQKFEFRLFSYSNVEDTYTITGYLNLPKYWLESRDTATLGTSSTALKEIATTCGLTYEGPATSDFQLWHPYNSKYSRFAKEIALSSWIDANSCMQLAVTRDKKMRLLNVSNFNNAASVELFSNRTTSSVSLPVTSINVLTKSGFLNGETGYQDTLIGQSLTTTVDQDISELVVRKNSATLSMNAGIKSQVEQARVRYAPIDVGNVSLNFHRARYQNARLAGYFSFGAEIVVPQLTDATVLDTVSCDMTKSDVNGVQDISGKFLVTSKVLYVQGLNVFQKIEVFRHGNNLPNNTQV